jgi:hypothetical protein
MVYNPRRADSPVRKIVSTLKYGGQRWSRLPIAVVICSLTFSLATRFCNQITSPLHIVNSVERRSVEPKRQHVHRDAIRRVAAMADPAFLDTVRLYPRVTSTKMPPLREYFDKSLYKRPPPFQI